MMRASNAAALIMRYDAFLIDQFGTLHDGTRLYPGARETLARMKAEGRPVVLLSNSGKRAAHNAARLARMGIPDDLYAGFLTSGEAAHRMLTHGRVPAALGARSCLLLERDGDGALLRDLGLEPADASAADLVVIAGSEGDRVALEHYAGLLAPAASRGVPALCLNPDRTMIVPTGLAYGAGRIAELYGELGGPVTWIGKPYPAIFADALALLGNPDPARVAVIGDSVEHDVAGARGAGCAAWLVRTGILEGATDSAIAAECARFGAEPDGVLDAFG